MFAIWTEKNCPILNEEFAINNTFTLYYKCYVLLCYYTKIQKKYPLSSGCPLLKGVFSKHFTEL